MAKKKETVTLGCGLKRKKIPISEVSEFCSIPKIENSEISESFIFN